MINKKIIGLVLSCIAVGASAEVISFTEADGYVNGNLNFGSNVDLGWTGGGSAYVVSESAGVGKMTLSWPFANGATTLDKNLAAGEAEYVFRSDFTFNRVADSTTGGSNVELFRQLIATGHNSDHMYASLVQFNGNYKLVFQSNSGGISGQYIQSAAAIADTSLGFGAGDHASDALSLVFNLARGTTATDWDVEVLLLNNGATVSSISGTDRAGTAAFFTSALDVGFHNTSASRTAYVDGGIVFTSLTAAIPEPASIGLLCAASAGILFVRRRFKV